jgi:hypothetical protein
MRRLITLVALLVTLAVSASEAAKPTPKPSTGGKPTVTKTQTQKVGVTKTSAGKASTPKGSAVKGTSASASKSVKPAKATTQVASGGGQTKVSGKSLKSAKADTHIAKADKSLKAQGAQAKADAKTTKAEARTAKAGSSTTTSSTDGTRSLTSPTGTSTPSIDFTATKVGQKLENNSALRSKIEAKLQAAGYTGTAYEAAYGFKNLGQLNAATNMVQNHGTSFELLKVLMTGTYVDPVTRNVYRTQKLPDGTTQLVKPELATNAASTLSLGQAKQAISGGAVMPEIVVSTTTGTTTTTTTTSKTSTSPTATAGALTTTTGKSKPRKNNGTTTATQPGGNF